MTITLISGLIVRNNTISNLLIIGVLFQTVSITKLVYKLSKNKYGYEEYVKMQNIQTTN